MNTNKTYIPIVSLVITAALFLAGSLTAHAVSTFSVQQGGTGTTTLQAGRLIYGGNSALTPDGKAYQSVATTTADCTGGTSCSQFIVIGNSPVTISTAAAAAAGFPFTPTTNFAQAANATTTQIWFQGSPTSLSASSTAHFTMLQASGTTTIGYGDNSLLINGVSYPWKFGISEDDENQHAGLSIERNATTCPLGCGIIGARSRGDRNSKTIVQDGDQILNIWGTSFDGTDYGVSTRIQSVVDGTPGNNDTPGALAFWTTADGASSASQRLTIKNSGNIGIGTTTPNWLLQIAGTRPSFAISDTAAGANLKHWLISSMGGNLYIGTSTDAYATTTPAALTLTNSGTVGVGVAPTGGYSLSVTSGSSGSIPAFQVTRNGASQDFAIGAFGITTIRGGGGTGSNSLGVSTASTAVTGISVKGSSGQVSPLQNWVNSSNSVLAVVSPLGYLGVGTSTPYWSGQFASSSANAGSGFGQLALTDTNAGTNLKHWLLSSMGGNLYIGTSTDAFGTSTPAALSIANDGTITLAKDLTVPEGGTGVSTFTSSQLLYGNGTNALSSVATTSVTCSGNTTCTAFTAIGASPITISSTGGGSGLSTTSPIASSNVLVYSSVGAGSAYGIATSSISVSAGLTNTGTLGSQVGGTALTLKQIENRSFSYATTSWTGTTTLPLEVGYGEVWNNYKCFTDIGTLNVQFGYGSASTTLFNASTTIGTVTATPNNTMTSGNKVVVDIGTPASSPKSITCTVNNTN